MQKGPIYISISRVLAGDASNNNAALEKLCRQLADRTVFVPTKDSTDSSVTRAPTPVQVVRIVDSKGRHLVPIFLHQNTLSEWCQSEGLSENFISLLGADICIALDQNSWIILEAGTENELKLEPKVVELISKVGQEQDQEETQSKSTTTVSPQTPSTKAVTNRTNSTTELSASVKREVVKNKSQILTTPQKSKGLFGFLKGLRAE